MDEDTAALVVLGALFVFILSTPLLITGCIALGATRKWASERRNGGITKGDIETDRLMPSPDDDSESEIDFLDSEDEDYYNAKRQRKIQEREDREAEFRLTTRAKFLKEWKKCWTGPGNVEQRKQEQAFKEDEQHRKIARQAVREYLRIERKKARKAARKNAGKEEMELPTYGNAVKAAQ